MATNRRVASRKPPEEMVVIVEDVIKLLDSLSESLRRGSLPRQGARQQGRPGAARGGGRPRAVTAALKTDPTLRGAVDTAREAAVSIAEAGAVGEHLGMEMVEDRLATHYFTCTARAYLGWRWAVSVARVPRSKTVTVCEANLVPGEGALLSPDWVPYAERLAPGDVGPGDVTPLVADDPNLEPGFEATGDEDVDQVGPVGARPRAARACCRPRAARPRPSAGTTASPAPAPRWPSRPRRPCSTCGFFVPMAGALRSVFGVCANEWSPSDARVVSLDHGCGAHSEVDVDLHTAERISPPILDDFELDPA